MPGTTDGSPRARVLGAWLRDAREAKDIGTRELGRMLEIPHTYISRWENAERMPRPEDVSMVLTALGVNGSARERLVKLAQATTEPNWVALGEPGASEALTALLEFEATANTVVDWSPSVIPGLLQTGDYARAIMHGYGAPQQEITPRVRVRIGRREVLTRRDPAPVELHALIGQEALRQVIGGAEVMADQLRQVVRFAELPAVTVQVVPTGEGWHPGLAGPFELLKFETGRPIVLLEHLRSSLFLYEQEEDLQAYVSGAARLARLAMSPTDSVELIAEVANTLERTKL